MIRIFLQEKRTIFSCSKEFLTKLQEEFPSTIPTVFKTGAKLTATATNNFEISTNTHSTSSLMNDDIETFSDDFNIKNNQDFHRCILCSCFKNYTSDNKTLENSAAIEAVKISRLLSSLQPPNSIFQELEQQKADSSFEQSVCYGCLRIINKMVSKVIF